MKKFFILILLLAMENVAMAQQVYTDSNSHPRPYYYKQRKHCGATRVGEGLMIGGGAIALIGVLSGMNNGLFSSNPQQSSGSDLITAVYLYIGGSIALYGAIPFFIGKNYERRHRDKFSIIIRGSTAGIAYHF